MVKKEYRVKSLDGKQAVYFGRDGNFYIKDTDVEGKVFKTEDWELAYSVWQAAGGEYGDMRIFEERRS